MQGRAVTEVESTVQRNRKHFGVCVTDLRTKVRWWHVTMKTVVSSGLISNVLDLCHMSMALQQMMSGFVPLVPQEL